MNFKTVFLPGDRTKITTNFIADLELDKKLEQIFTKAIAFLEVLIGVKDIISAVNNSSHRRIKRCRWRFPSLFIKIISKNK